MHPAVQMKTLGRLSPSIRRIATVACGNNRSLESLERVGDCMHPSIMDASQRFLLLPVFFSHLDPAEIPTAEQLEIFRTETKETIARAVSSLDAIFHIRITKDVGFSLWPRVWPWFHFIHAHWDHLPGIELPAKLIFYTDFVLCAGKFHDDPPTSDFMSATPGFRAMLVKAWSFLPDMDAPRLDLVLYDLCRFIIDSEATDRESLAEMVESAGGALDNLASLIVEYVNTVVARESTLRPNSILYYIRGLCSFIADADLYPVEQKQWLLVPLGPLTSILPFHGFVEALVAAILSLTKTSTIDTGPTLNECFMLLGRILIGDLGYLWLEETLEQGLIRAMVVCSTLDCARKINHHMRYLLRHVIPNGLVYYYIVSEVKSSLVEVKELISNDAFRNCAVFEHWERFFLLVDERLECLAEFHSPGFVQSRACDNLECGEIEEKWYFERCSGCKAFYYCSAECQLSDWQDGGHRKACRSYNNLALTELGQPKLVVRERAFLRALVHRNYEQNMHSVCTKQMKFMVDNPTCTLFLTLFNYSHGAVEIDVHSAIDSPLAATLQNVGGVEWRDMMARAVRSDGLLQLHIVQVYQGPRVRHWVVPLRSDSSTIFKGLRKAARTLMPESTEEDIVARIDSVRHLDPDMREIH